MRINVTTVDGRRGLLTDEDFRSRGKPVLIVDGRICGKRTAGLLQAETEQERLALHNAGYAVEDLSCELCGQTTKECLCDLNDEEFCLFCGQTTEECLCDIGAERQRLRCEYCGEVVERCSCEDFSSDDIDVGFFSDDDINAD